MEDKYLNTRTRNLKKIIMSRDSFQRLIKENEPLNKNLDKLNENYYHNIKAIFGSDEKKNQVMSFIEKLRFKNRLKQRSVSPLLLKFDNFGISTEKSYTKDLSTLRVEKSIDTIKNNNSHKIRKRYEKLKNELSGNNSNICYDIKSDNENPLEEKSIDKNIIVENINSIEKNSSENNTDKINIINNLNNKSINKNIIDNCNSEDKNEKKNGIENMKLSDNKRNMKLIEDEKIIIEDKRNKEKQLKRYHKKNFGSDNIPNIKIKKKEEQLKITFKRINISISRKKNNDNKNKNLFKENFFFTIKPKLLTYKKKTIIHPKKTQLKKESTNFSININNKSIKDKYTGYKLIKYEEGKKINEILLNESIENINKKLEEEKIKIGNLQIKLKLINEYTNEVDQIENFNIISNLIKEKVKLNLVNRGMNTLRDKRKFKEIGINVSNNRIFSNSGNNTDITLVNWDKYFTKNNLMKFNNKGDNNKKSNYHKSNSCVMENKKEIKSNKNNYINLKYSIMLENKKKFKDNYNDTHLNENFSFFDNSHVIKDK